MSALLPVSHLNDVLPAYWSTPAADLLACHNLRSPHRSYDHAELLIGMSMDSEARRPRQRYPRVIVAPLFWSIGDKRWALKA